MSTFDVNTEDLGQVDQRLGAQAQQLNASLADVTQACAALRDTVLSTVSASEATITTACEQIVSTLQQSGTMAQQTVWTGPDSEQFRAGTAELMDQINQISLRVQENVQQYRTTTEQLHSELETQRAGFAQAIGKDQESTTSLQQAIQTETRTYEEAFAGGFTG